jgi:hypothetical protein
LNKISCFWPGIRKKKKKSIFGLKYRIFRPKVQIAYRCVLQEGISDCANTIIEMTWSANNPHLLILAEISTALILLFFVFVYFSYLNIKNDSEASPNEYRAWFAHLISIFRPRSAAKIVMGHEQSAQREQREELRAAGTNAPCNPGQGSAHQETRRYGELCTPKPGSVKCPLF